MKIGFIGCGNMASAIIGGITGSSKLNNATVFAYDINKNARELVKNKYNVTVCTDECEVTKESDIIFLAVKPDKIKSVLSKIDNYITDEKVIVSIAAGKTIEFIASNLTSRKKIVRVMPNINAKVGEAICGYCYNDLVSDEEIKDVEGILGCFGKYLFVEESKFPIYSVLGGCSPAFVYMFIDSLARSGVKNGLKKDDALKIAAQAVYGSAKMIMESNEHPWQLVDNVCSPGGTTIEGVTALQENGFENAITKAVDASFEKDSRL